MTEKAKRGKRLIIESDSDSDGGSDFVDSDSSYVSEEYQHDDAPEQGPDDDSDSEVRAPRTPSAEDMANGMRSTCEPQGGAEQGRQWGGGHGGFECARRYTTQPCVTRTSCRFTLIGVSS